VKIGDLFKKQGQNAWYQVTSVNLATNINISPVYAAASVAGVSYLIVRDFTPIFNLPEISGGDYDWQDAYTRAIRTIDSNLSASAGNKWWNIVGDAGSASPNAIKDTLTFAGQGGITASIDGDTVTIRNAGGDTTATRWYTIAGDAGSTTPNILKDTLTFAGQGGITASIDGDTVTLRYSGAGAPVVQFITASYHIQSSDTLIIASLTSGAASTFLPDASTARLLRFVCASGGGDMIVIASDTDTIEGKDLIRNIPATGSLDPSSTSGS
ncbi:unnamed protein product, partial [marine sediment metagenome]